MNTQNNNFGVNSWWTVPEVTVPVEVAHAALSKHGFDPDMMKAPTRRNEVSRAVNSLQDRRTRDQQTIARPTGDNGAIVTYGVLGEGRVDAETVDFHQDTTVRLDKATGEVVIEGERSEAVSKAIQHYTGKVTDADVRNFLRNIIRKCHGVPKRPTGGIYFIPSAFAPLLERAQAVLDDINSSAHLYIEGVVNGERERKNVWEAVERDIEGELEKTLSAVDRIERSSKAVKGHEMRIAGLQQMMDVYTDLLGKQAENETLSEKLAEAVNTVAHKVSELQSQTTGTVRKVTSRKRSSKVYEAAIDVLTQSGEAMHYRDITAAMIAAGSYEESKNSEAAVRGTLQRMAAKPDTRLQKVGRGLYKVAATEASEAEVEGEAVEEEAVA